MAAEGEMKRRKAVKEFREAEPLTSKVRERIRKAKVALSIIMTDRGLYLSAQRKLREIYNGAVSRIRRLFKR